MSDAPQIPVEEPYPELTNDVKNWAVLAHLSAFLGYAVPVAGKVLGPLAVYLIKGKEHPFIEDQAREALNFQLSVTIYLMIAALMICIGIGIVLVPLLLVTDAILVVIAAVHASRGEAYRYPLTIRFIH